MKHNPFYILSPFRRRNLLFQKIILFFALMLSGVEVKAGLTNPEPIIDTVWNTQLAARIYNLKFLPGDSIIFVAGGNTIFFVETKTGKVLEKYVNDLELTSSALTFNGDRIYVPTKSINNKRSIRAFEIKTRKFLEPFDGEVEMIKSIACAPDERFIATNCSTYGLGLWNSQIQSLEKLMLIDGFEQYGAEFSSDNKYLCSKIYFNSGPLGSEYTSYLVYSYPEFEKKYEKINFGGYLFNSGKLLFRTVKVQPNEYQLEFYELDSLKYIKTTNIEKFDTPGYDTHFPLAISKNDRYIVTCSYSKITMVWDLEREINVVNYRLVPDDPLLTIAISSDMKYIVGGVEGHLVLLNAHWEPTSVGDKGLINATLKIAPNIINNSLNIEFVSEFEDKLKLTITSIRADVVFTEENISSITGINRKVLQIPALANGEYFLNLIGNKSKYSGKFIISR